MKKTLSKFVLAVTMFAFAVSVNAAGQFCQGAVSNVFVYLDGTVYVQPTYRGDYVRICNMNAETSGISITTCATWFAILRSAVQRNSQIMVYYPDAPACAALPTYGASPIPGYVMQMN